MKYFLSNVNQNTHEVNTFYSQEIDNSIDAQIEIIIGSVYFHGPLDVRTHSSLTVRDKI
jgi:hypothetical protein